MTSNSSPASDDSIDHGSKAVPSSRSPHTFCLTGLVPSFRKQKLYHRGGQAVGSFGVPSNGANDGHSEMPATAVVPNVAPTLDDSKASVPSKARSSQVLGSGTKSEKEHRCQTCGVGCIRRGDARTHFKKHCGSEVVWQCNDTKCGKVAQSNQLAKRHQEETHRNNPPGYTERNLRYNRKAFSCAFCAKVIGSRDEFVEHVIKNCPRRDDSRQADTNSRIQSLLRADHLREPVDEVCVALGVDTVRTLSWDYQPSKTSQVIQKLEYGVRDVVRPKRNDVHPDKDHVHPEINLGIPGSWLKPFLTCLILQARNEAEIPWQPQIPSRRPSDDDMSTVEWQQAFQTWQGYSSPWPPERLENTSGEAVGSTSMSTANFKPNTGSKRPASGSLQLESIKRVCNYPFLGMDCPQHSHQPSEPTCSSWDADALGQIDLNNAFGSPLDLPPMANWSDGTFDLTADGDYDFNQLVARPYDPATDLWQGPGWS